MLSSRRRFFGQVAAIGSALSLPPLFVRAAPVRNTGSAEPMNNELVREYITVAHGDLDCLKAILEVHPLMLNAAWDWGDGDFETALGAAGHVGRRDIAEFLLGKGARADIFVLTMLGETALVKAKLERFPSLLHSFGPHGFTLLHHAKKGGEQAKELVDHLGELGLTETYVNIFNKKN